LQGRPTWLGWFWDRFLAEACIPEAGRRRCPQWTGLVAALMFAIGSPPCSGQVASAPGHATDALLRVEVASGRQFVGEVDLQTDAECLYLRSLQGSMLVVRPIDWERVLRAEIGGQALSAEQLRAAIEVVRQRYPQATGSRPLPGPRYTPASRSASSEPVRPAIVPRVRSLSIDASTANWDADVEVDGLLVRVYPLDEQGRIVPVDGTLEVELVAPRTGLGSEPAVPPQIGRWVRRARPEDFPDSGFFVEGAPYRLEFQAVHPEFDRHVVAHGLVHARLNVPGQGTFEATSPTVRIRPYNAARDWLQQATGRRFLPSERVGRSEP